MKRIIKFSTLVFLFSACASLSVSYDYDKNADFNKYKTYAFDEQVDQLKVNQLDKNRVISAIENEMSARGYTKSDAPDMLVGIHTRVEQEESATATTTGAGMYGGPWRYGFGGGFTTTNVDINKYDVGTLFINVIDGGSKEIVWQGRGTKTLAENVSPEKKEERINAAVAAIFKKYPVPAK